MVKSHNFSWMWHKYLCYFILRLKKDLQSSWDLCLWSRSSSVPFHVLRSFQILEKKQFTGASFLILILLAHLNIKSSYKMHSRTKNIDPSHLRAPLWQVWPVFQLQWVNIDLWWVAVLKTQLSLMSVSWQYHGGKVILESDGGWVNSSSLGTLSC